jgi:hypothetical protein
MNQLLWLFAVITISNSTDIKIKKLKELKATNLFVAKGLCHQLLNADGVTSIEVSD